MDLDNTLIHAIQNEPRPEERKECITIEVSLFFDLLKYDGNKIYVFKRPFLDKFLKNVSKHGTLTLFTAGMQSYADAILEVIDPEKLIKTKYYR